MEKVLQALNMGVLLLPPEACSVARSPWTRQPWQPCCTLSKLVVAAAGASCLRRKARDFSGVHAADLFSTADAPAKKRIGRQTTRWSARQKD
mmetsp:Transcript_13310/g.24487  ORF Transcript_13310/g.24487 Transcript_13310/m.24487 type:complete len:92 (-) Transcript_13310:284-559(-)